MMEVRLLHKDSSHGYTEQSAMALSAEPEAVTEEEQRVISIRARTGFVETRQAEDRRRDREQWLTRLRKAEMSAESRGIDIFRSQVVIRKEILNIEQRLSGRGTFFGGSLVTA